MTPEIKKQEVYVVSDKNEIIGYFQTKKEAENLVKEYSGITNPN